MSDSDAKFAIWFFGIGFALGYAGIAAWLVCYACGVKL